VLNQSIAEKANVVNAVAIARREGYRSTKTKRATFEGRVGDMISGFAENNVRKNGWLKAPCSKGIRWRLLGVDAIAIEVPLQGNLITCATLTFPEFVGKVGSILGRGR